MKAAALTSYDIFLSHSFIDRDLLGGAVELFESMNYTVYIDWKDDSQLSRQAVTKSTADILRERVGRSAALFFATTPNAPTSKWMPWELGYMDGNKGKSAILPVSDEVRSSDSYIGQEYLGVYPYVTVGNDTKGRRRLWIRENLDVYVSFDSWLKGNEPRRRS
jgi:hypothetical protein